MDVRASMSSRQSTAADPQPHYRLDPVHRRFAATFEIDRARSSPLQPQSGSESASSSSSSCSTETAFLEFDWVDSTTLDVFHTEVPAALRGRGVGRDLLVAALPALAQLEPRTVLLSCSYLQHLHQKGALESLKADLPYRLTVPTVIPTDRPSE